MFFTTSHVFFRRTRKKRNKTMKNSFCNHKIRNICCQRGCFRYYPALMSRHHGFFFGLPPDPLRYKTHGIVLLGLRKPYAFGNAVPFFKTTATATRRGVLRNEHRVKSVAHGRLFSVVSYFRRCQSLSHNFGGMLFYHRHAFGSDVFLFFFVQRKTAAKPRHSKPLHSLVHAFELPLHAVFLCLGFPKRCEQILFVSAAVFFHVGNA